MGPTPPETKNQGTRYYNITDDSGKVQQYILSADGETWYAVQPDGSRMKCPPNISIMLAKRLADFNQDRENDR